MHKDDICKLIPHTGNMCLIESIQEWDDKQIICHSKTHQLKNNPLKIGNSLSIITLIEYGAQTMAIHGSLLAQRNNKIMHSGYLASLRDVKFTYKNINTLGELEITATQKLMTAGNMIYNFKITSADQFLISGQAIVMAELKEKYK